MGQRFLGALNYYRRFIPHAAAIQSPLYKALQGKPKALQWTDARAEAFENTKEALASATMLVHPVEGAPLALTATDSTCTEQNYNGTKLYKQIDWAKAKVLMRRSVNTK